MQKLYTRLFFIMFILMTTINVQSQVAIKRALVEEYTGAWCSSCAFGSVYSEHLANNYPNAIFIAIHSGDPMQNFSITGYMTNYYDALPTFLYDRVDFPTNPGQVSAVSAYPWNTGLDTLDHYLDIQYNQSPIVTVGIDQVYDAITREITVTISGNFVANATGDFRLNCFIVEDSISGGQEYNQSNTNFSGWTGGPSYLQPLIDSDPIIAGYQHNHVVREMLGTPAGATASIPTTVTNGSSYSKTFTYVLPAEYDENQISLVGTVQRFGADINTDREIVNANSQHLNLDSDDPTSSLSAISNNIIDLIVYPNPIDESSKVEFYVKKTGVITCSIYNSLGQEVAMLFNKQFTQGEYKINLNQYDLKSGIYYLKFNQNQSLQTEKICVK